MSTKYKFHDQDKLYFVSFAIVNWIDLFIRNEYKDIMIDSWKSRIAIGTSNIKASKCMAIAS